MIVATAPTTHFFVGNEICYPSKPFSTNIKSNPNAGASQSKPSNGQSPSTTTLKLSVSKVKGLLHVTELQMTSSSGRNTTALSSATTLALTVFCPIVLQTDLIRTLLEITIETNLQGYKDRGAIDFKLAQLTASLSNIQALEPFNVSSYVKENLIGALQKTYPHLYRVAYCYGNIKKIPELDVHHGIHLFKYFAANEKGLLFAVRLPIC